MPKTLSQPPPTSSVANMLDPGIGSAVLAAVKQFPRGASDARLPAGIGSAVLAAVKPLPARTPAFPPAGSPDNPDAVYLKREFVLTQTADHTLKRLVGLFEVATGTTVSNSHVLRAVLSLVADSWPDLEREAARLGPLARPSNARGKEGERVAFEEALAEALLAGLRAGGKAG